MKAYFLPLGAGADRGLPAVLTALACGAAREVPRVSMLRVLSAPPAPLADRMMADLNVCHTLFDGKDAFAFFQTSFSSAVWVPALPGREAFGPGSGLLLSALRGKGVPLSFRTDREAVEWSLSMLLEAPESAPEFHAFLLKIEEDLAAGEDVRILLMCDLTDGFSAGLAMGLLRFFRARLGERTPFIGLVSLVRPLGSAPDQALADARGALLSLSRRNLVRAAEDRETLGADACWLLGMPSGLMVTEDSGRLADWAAARILGSAFGGVRRPTPGLHTLEMPGILTLQSFDTEAKPLAAFLRGSFWCLSDLFPALHQFFDHPALLRSLAPATRNGLFRRLFREAAGGISEPPEFAVLERTLRAMNLEILTLIRTLPSPLREAEASGEIWQEAVRACGRTVTVGSEYDVSRKEAEESGVDKVAPVHRESMKDTKEEELLRRLDNMAEEVAAAEAEREEVFSRLGGYRARLALEDCLSRCRVAEVSAREKLGLLPADSPEDRLTLGRQERRVRLLQASIRRCEKDLEKIQVREALSRPGTLVLPKPFAGEILDPDLAEQGFDLLTGGAEKAEPAARVLREGLDRLLRGYPMNDGKTLLKNLLSVCRQGDGESPLRGLMAGVFSVCGVEVAGVRFQGAGELPALNLLPDLTEEGRFFTVSAAPDRILAPGEADRTGELRGLLALLLLRQYRRRKPEEAELVLEPCRPEDSVLSRIWLGSRGADQAWIAALRRGEETLPLALILPEEGLESARLVSAGEGWIPDFCLWASPEAPVFRDPCVYLSEADRQILTEQFTRLRARMKSPRSKRFLDFLSDWHQEIVQAPRLQPEDPDLRQRLRVVCGLQRLPIWQKDLHRVSSFFESSLPGDPLCAALSGQESFEAAACKIHEEVLHTFRGSPIARESAVHLLESAHLPEEGILLSSLGAECDILAHSSDDYHEALAAGLEEMIRRYPAADPEDVAVAQKLLDEAREPIRDQITELTWPWDTVSASVSTILTECLGPELAGPALKPFSSRLALFPARGGDIIGDTLLSSLCRVEQEEVPREEPAGEEAEVPSPRAQADCVLPPLSPEFARAVCRDPRGQSLIQPGFLSFEKKPNGVQVTMTLEGAFTLRLIRLYPETETVLLYAHDMPTLALWPSLPFDPESWHAYFSYAHCSPDFRFAAVTRAGETPLSGSAPRLAERTDTYPLGYLIWYQDQSVGALPNLLPSPELPSRGECVACLDFGASAISLVFSDGEACWPMQGPVSVRTLLRSPAASEPLLWREFLPGVPMSPVLPGALRLFRNDLEEADLPFRDGAVFMSSSLRDVLDVSSEALYTDLKWNGEKGRAVGILLHQVMLMAALEARRGGAAALGWRLAVPDEMAQEGRERLAQLLRTLADTVSAESAVPLPAKAPAVSFGSESAALGAYFRLCSPEESRGGFMVLDLGADTADLSLFLRGRDQAVRATQLPLGLHYMLLPALLRRPEILRDDFGYIPQPDFQRDLADLQTLLERARRDPAALRQARYGLDAMIADHLPLLHSALAQRRGDGAPGLTGALLLLHFSFLMMLCGLTLLQVSHDSQKNDYLPERMTLFLAGRGASLPEGLSIPAKTSLWRLLTMFRNPRVASLNLVFSAEKKLEIPVGLSVMPDIYAGLPKPASAPVSMAVRPEELVPEFLLRFRREFTPEADLLFPGIFANDPYAPFSPWGQQVLAQALQSAFGDREAGRPYPALISCLTQIMELIQEGPAI